MRISDWSSDVCSSDLLRPTLIYGAEDTHNSYGPNRLRRMARKDARITLFGAGEETRDHISVDDVYRLILLTLRHRSEGVVNLATGHSISYMELARKIAYLFDTPVDRSEEHTSELQSLLRISSAGF